jgi:hypothetical protein
MKRSFAERRYSPSIGMDQSEWEIILEQLVITGYIVKEEPVSETDRLICSLLAGLFCCATFRFFCLVVSPSCNLSRYITFAQFISLYCLRAIYFIVSPSGNLFHCVTFQRFCLRVKLLSCISGCISERDASFYRRSFEPLHELSLKRHFALWPPLQKSLWALLQGSGLYYTTVW